MHLQERRILALVSSHIFYHHNLWLHFPIHATNKTECNSVTGLNELSHDSNQYFLVEWVLLTEWGTDIFGTINKYILEGKGLNIKWNSVSTLLWVVNNPPPPSTSTKKNLRKLQWKIFQVLDKIPWGGSWHTNMICGFGLFRTRPFYSTWNFSRVNTIVKTSIKLIKEFFKELL